MSSISNAHNSVVRSASSLQRRFLLGAGLGGTGLILVLAWGADLALDRFMRRETEARLDGAAQRAQLLVDQSLADRERQVEVLALDPAVVDAAREGGALAPPRSASPTTPRPSSSSASRPTARFRLRRPPAPSCSACFRASTRRHVDHRGSRLQRPDHPPHLRLRPERRGVVGVRRRGQEQLRHGRSA